MKRLLRLLALSSSLLALSFAPAPAYTRVFDNIQITGVGGPNTVTGTLDLSAATVTFANNQIAIAKVNGLQAALDAKQPIDADLTAIAGLSTQPFGRSLLTGATAGAVNTLLGLSGLFQPLENQRLSTGYSPTFAGLTLNGALTGAFGDTITNLYAGGIQIYADSTGFGSTQAYRIGDFGYGGSYHSLTDGIDNWDTGGGGLVIASGAAQIDTVGHFSGNGFSDLTGNGFQGSSFDVFTNPSSGLWDFGSADVRGRSLFLYDGGAGIDGQISYHSSINAFEFGGNDLSYVGSVNFAYNLGGGSGDYISNPSSGLWDFGSAGLTTSNGQITLTPGGEITASSITAKSVLTAATAAFTLNGVNYYPHVSAGVLTFTTTP